MALTPLSAGAPLPSGTDTAGAAVLIGCLFQRLLQSRLP